MIVHIKGAAMMKKITLIVFLIFLLLLISCRKQHNTTDVSLNPTPPPTAVCEESLMDLSGFVGEWTVGMLKVAPRAALMEESYARDNSDLSGKKLTIAKNGVIFDKRMFYYKSIETLNAEELMSHFNIPIGQTLNIQAYKTVQTISLYH